MRKVFVPAVLVLVLIVGGMVAWQWYAAHQAGKEIRLSGNIEVTEVQLSFRIAGWVQTRAVDEGDVVTQGQLAAKLDTTELAQNAAQRQATADAAQAASAQLENGSRPEEIAEAQAQMTQAQAALAERLNGSRPQEIAAAQATVAAAQATEHFAELDFARMDKTVQSGGVTREQRDNSVMSMNVAQAKLAEAQENLALVKQGPRQEEIDQARAASVAAEQRYALVKKGPRQEVIDQARAALAQAQQAGAVAQTQLSYATLLCPVPGVVLSKNVEAGEFVAAGTPIVTIGNLQDVWVRAYVDETDLGRIKLGQKANVRTDSYPDKTYTGKVAFISAEAEFTPKTVQTPKERVKLVYRVKIDIENTNMELKPGMPADVVIPAE